MKIVLIAVPLMEWIDGELCSISMDRIRSTPPLGVYWLAGVLHANGYQADVMDLIASGEIDIQQIKAKVGQADLVGISANSLNWPTARKITEIIKLEFPDLPVVLGGIHPGGYPEHVLARCSADYIIQGEGEQPLLGLVKALSTRTEVLGVPGLGYRTEDGSVIVNPNGGLTSVEAVEMLPDPLYELLPDQVYESLSIESARGCKFKCTFCSTKFLGSWRGVSAENFVDRLERLLPFVDKTRYGVFSIIDDLYTLNIKRVKEITDLLDDRGIPIQATLDARATDVIRGEVAEALAPITNHMLIGAECGYNEGLRKISKGCTVEVLEKAASMLNSVGLSKRVVFSFVIGFPFETRAECEKTIKFATHLLLKYNVRIYIQWYNTIPGSKIWEELQEEERVDIWMYDDFGFFSNKYLFKAGVRLTESDVLELTETIRSINAMLLMTMPSDDIIQFAPPEWLNHSETLNFPSHAAIEDARKSGPTLSRADVAGLVSLGKA